MLAPPPVADLEDLIKHAHAHALCPFDLSRALAASADVVLMPDHPLDPLVRERFNEFADLSNCAIVIDEGHNVPDACRGALMCSFSDLGLKNMKELNNVDVPGIEASAETAGAPR